VKSYLQVSSEIGILAVGVALLMIAGEFDLSIGSLIGFLKYVNNITDHRSKYVQCL
jgi:ribose/xylose/arabinose/galactoside ABC-type transport system permease subunit